MVERSIAIRLRVQTETRKPGSECTFLTRLLAGTPLSCRAVLAVVKAAGVVTARRFCEA